jgi:HK97 family phage portal protein
MGLLETLGLRTRAEAPQSTPKVRAQLNPPVMDAPYGNYYGNNAWGGYGSYVNAITRQNAMAVPSIVRCRNLVCNTVAAIPLKTYDKATGKEIPNMPWIEQLDKRQPRAVTLAWLCDSLLMYGVAYLRVEELYADDNRPSSFEWIQNDRVTTKYNAKTTAIDYYMVDSVKVPDSGIGSLVTFQALNQGILLTSLQTIQAALNIEKAASIASETPMGSGYIKNNGSDIPEEEVQGILNSWKNARNSRGTAYLTQTLDYQSVAFSPKDMMYNEAKQYFATELARVCNVPAWMIDAEVMRSMTYQNIIDARKDFMAYSLAPFISAIEARLSMDDLTPRTQEVRFAVDDTFLRVDPLARLQVIQMMLELQLISLDQAKQMEGLAPDGSGLTNDALNL